MSKSRGEREVTDSFTFCSFWAGPGETCFGPLPRRHCPLLVAQIQSMAVDQPGSSRTGLPTTNPVGKASQTQQTETKARGANRSTKVAGKLKVLPDQPDVPTQPKVLSEPPKPVEQKEEQKEGTSPESDEDGEDEDEVEEQEEQEVEV